MISSIDFTFKMRQSSMMMFCMILFSFPIFAKDAKHILFIGNSYTYRNHMPKMVAELAKSNGRQVDVQWNVRGKTSFYQHIGRPALFQAIQWKPWDIVVLQGSSRDMLKGETYMRTKTIPALKKMIKAIRKRNPNAHIVFYMTWAYKNGYKPNRNANSFAKMTNLVAKEYIEIAKMFDASIAPVGLFWMNLKSKNPKIALHQPDKAHPSKLGSFATACCMYCTLFKSPIQRIPKGLKSIKYNDYIRRSSNEFMFSVQE